MHANVVRPIERQLLERASASGFAAHVYCFMPDHVHALMEGVRADARFDQFVASFKQASGFWYRRSYGAPLWQRGYWERVLRSHELTNDAMRYIATNPVAAGLVGRAEDYPFLGSGRVEVSSPRRG